MQWFKNIIEKITLIFDNTRTNSPSIKNVQKARGDIHNVSNQIVLYSVEELAGKLLNSSFQELPLETKVNIENNQKSYFQILAENLKKIAINQEQLKNIIDSPDFQYISKKAVISASRSASPDLHKTLSLLLIDRINYNENDLKRIAYNEAISTIEKLTSNQLKILALCFLIKRTKVEGLNTVQQFANYLTTYIAPFLNFKDSRAQFEHLVYTGCADRSVATHDVIKIFENNYKNIFNGDNSDIQKALLDNATANQLFTIWNKSEIKRINLTSVGIIIASSYYEQITNDKINIDIWIN